METELSPKWIALSEGFCWPPNTQFPRWVWRFVDSRPTSSKPVVDKKRSSRPFLFSPPSLSTSPTTTIDHHV